MFFNEKKTWVDPPIVPPFGPPPCAAAVALVAFASRAAAGFAGTSMAMENLAAKLGVCKDDIGI